jgi:hypothetical protein
MRLMFALSSLRATSCRATDSGSRLCESHVRQEGFPRNEVRVARRTTQRKEKVIRTSWFMLVFPLLIAGSGGLTVSVGVRVGRTYFRGGRPHWPESLMTIQPETVRR